MTRITLVLLFAFPAALYAQTPLRSTIDERIRAAWTEQNVIPAPRADDATFLRRVYLDLIGTIPTYAEARAFLADTDPKKREKLVDRLLDDARFATHQAEVWDLVLFGRNPSGGDAVRKRDDFRKWLAEQFAKNVPYDRWVRELLLAEQAGSEMFYVQFRNQPEDATVAVSRIFLGTQLQCARCHDHPYEEWTQRDFFGMAGFFVRLVVLDGEAGSNGSRRYRIAEKRTGEVLFSGAAKDQKAGTKGEPIVAKFLTGPTLAEPAVPKDFKEPTPKAGMPKPDFSRKEKLAAWLTTPDNPFFARAAANRLWGQFMGRGFVQPVDDLSSKNEPSHPELLDALTQALIAQKFDLKAIMREIVNSNAYQVGATGPNTAALPQWYERARVRPLSAEEMLRSIRTANAADGEKVPGDTNEYFLRYFGEPTNGLGDFQGSLSEHLFLNNSGNIRQMIQRRKGNLADVVLSSTEPWEARVDRLFLACLTRLPTERERQRFITHLTSQPKADALVEEAIWVLINTPEFRFHH